MDTKIVANNTNNNFFVGRNGKDGKNGKDGTSFITTTDNLLSCNVGNLGDTVLSLPSGNLYLKQEGTTVFPAVPQIKEIPEPTGNTILVGTGQTFTTIASAYASASAGDELLLNANETFFVTQVLNLSFPVTIRGQENTVIEMSSSPLIGQPYIFNLTAPSGIFVFKNFEIRMPFTDISFGQTACINVPTTNVTLNNIFIDNCNFGVSELGIVSCARALQVTNSNFYYASPQLENSHRYIFICNIVDDYIIANNTFVTGSGNNRTWFVSISNIPPLIGTLSGSLVLLNNTQLVGTFSLRHLLGIEQWIGSNFKIFIKGNILINEGNMPILFSTLNNNILEFILISDNTFQNTAGKGIVGVFTSFGAPTGTSIIYAENNIIANQSFITGWFTTTNPNSILAGLDFGDGEIILYELFTQNCLKFLGNIKV